MAIQQRVTLIFEGLVTLIRRYVNGEGSSSEMIETTCPSADETDAAEAIRNLEWYYCSLESLACAFPMGIVLNGFQ